jgi:type II secretory pathway pseudopilin PulG
MTELIVAMVVLGALLTVLGQTVTTVARQQRIARQQHVAVQEVSNGMESAFAMPYNELTAASLQALPISATAREILSNVDWAARVTAIEEQPLRKRIQLELRWGGRGGRATQQVGLAADRYAGAKGGAGE